MPAAVRVDSRLLLGFAGASGARRGEFAHQADDCLERTLDAGEGSEDGVLHRRVADFSLEDVDADSAGAHEFPAVIPEGVEGRFGADDVPPCTEFRFVHDSVFVPLHRVHPFLGC